MFRPKPLTGLAVAFVFLTLVSSARADVVNVDMNLEKLFYAHNHNLTALDVPLAESGYLYGGHFENNSGKHLGFSMAAVTRGPRLGIVRPQRPSVSENPEPATMLLLGTGLAAAAGLKRRNSRRRRS